MGSTDGICFVNLHVIFNHKLDLHTLPEKKILIYYHVDEVVTKVYKFLNFLSYNEINVVNISSLW